MTDGVGNAIPYLLPRRSVRSEAGGWALSIAGALSLHAGAVALMLVDFGDGRPAPVAPPMAAMTVELAPLPAAPEQKQTEVPPGPQQVEQQVQPRPQPKRRLFDPPPEVKSSPPPDALAAKPEDEEEAQLASDRTTDTPTSVAMTEDDLQAPIEGSPSDQASSVEQTWENRLLTHLERHKRYPGTAQMRRQEDVIYLRFTMDRNGKVLNWNIERSRGYELLDREVNALIQRASPLPPPPNEVRGATIEMVVPVEFFLRRSYARVGA